MGLITRKRFLSTVSIFILLIASGFVLWAEFVPEPMPEALQALNSGSDVAVTIDDLLVFKPLSVEPDTGLVFYPGARVDPRSYAPAARELAAHGYLVVIVRMPLDLAILGSGKANSVIEKFTYIENWAVGGHSLGGAMAARFAYYHQNELEGLLLWAAYPASDNDLSGSDLSVTTIYGSQDGLATVKKVEESFNELPEKTEKVLIIGGNHAQFGWYGEQSGDKPAKISRESQQKQTVDASLVLLNRVKNSQ